MRLATNAATSKALPKAETRSSFTGSCQTSSWIDYTPKTAPCPLNRGPISKGRCSLVTTIYHKTCFVFGGVIYIRTNPFEKYARQMGSSSPGFEVNCIAMGCRGKIRGMKMEVQKLIIRLIYVEWTPYDTMEIPFFACYVFIKEKSKIKCKIERLKVYERRNRNEIELSRQSFLVGWCLGFWKLTDFLKNCLPLQLFWDSRTNGAKCQQGWKQIKDWKKNIR